MIEHTDRNNRQLLFESTLLDYLKTVALLFNLNFLDSVLISKEDFKQSVFNMLNKMSGKNIVKVINFIKIIETLTYTKYDAYNNNTENVQFKNIAFVIDLITTYQLNHAEMGEFYLYLEKNYKPVMEVFKFLISLTESEYNNYTNGFLLVGNIKEIEKGYERLIHKKEIKTFLNDFSPLKNETLRKKINSFYENITITNSVLNEFNSTTQNSFILLNSNTVNGILLPLSYYKSRFQFNGCNDGEYAISDYSQIIQVSLSHNISSSVKDKLVPINNFAFLRRCIICSGKNRSLLHFIRENNVLNTVKDQDAECASYDFLSAANISNLTSSAQDVSSFLSLNLFINFIRNYKKNDRRIDDDINKIFLNECYDFPSKYTEMELYLKNEISKGMLGGLKPKQTNDNVSFYSSLQSYIERKIKEYLEKKYEL